LIDRISFINLICMPVKRKQVNTFIFFSHYFSLNKRNKKDKYQKEENEERNQHFFWKKDQFWIADFLRVSWWKKRLFDRLRSFLDQFFRTRRCFLLEKIHYFLMNFSWIWLEKPLLLISCQRVMGSSSLVVKTLRNIRLLLEIQTVCLWLKAMKARKGSKEVMWNGGTNTNCVIYRKFSQNL